MIEFEIPFVCLIFTSLIALVFFLKKKIELQENFFYKNILIFTLCVNTTNFVSHYLANIYAKDGLTETFSNIFANIEPHIVNFLNFIHTPSWLLSLLIDGIYKTVTWIVSVMLPPMAIFFPLFTLLEDLGYLPRIAFNMDGFFKKCCCTR